MITFQYLLNEKPDSDFIQKLFEVVMTTKNTRDICYIHTVLNVKYASLEDAEKYDVEDDERIETDRKDWATIAQINEESLHWSSDYTKPKLNRGERISFISNHSSIRNPDGSLMLFCYCDYGILHIFNFIGNEDKINALNQTIVDLISNNKLNTTQISDCEVTHIRNNQLYIYESIRDDINDHERWNSFSAETFDFDVEYCESIRKFKQEAKVAICPHLILGKKVSSVITKIPIKKIYVTSHCLIFPKSIETNILKTIHTKESIGIYRDCNTLYIGGFKSVEFIDKIDL